MVQIMLRVVKFSVAASALLGAGLAVAVAVEQRQHPVELGPAVGAGRRGKAPLQGASATQRVDFRPDGLARDAAGNTASCCSASFDF